MDKFYKDQNNNLFYDRTLISECTPEIVQLYSGYNALSNQYTPEAVEVKFYFANSYTTSLTVAIQNLNYKFIHREQPIISCPGSKQRGLFDEFLTSLLRESIIKHNEKQTPALYLRKSGWNKLPNGNIAFLYGQDLIGQFDRPYCVAPTQPILRRSQRPTALKELAYSLANSSPIATQMAAYLILTTLRSQILDCGVDVQTVGYIFGPQGTGKTTLAKRMAAFVQPIYGLKPTNFFDASSTNAALREAMVEFRDLPVIVDDLCLSAGRQTERKRIEMASTLIRQAANDTTITLMSKKRQKMDKNCGAGVIITAEFTLNNASDITRCIFIPLKDTPHIDERIQPDLVREAMLNVVEWFQQNRQRAIDHLKEKIETFTVEKYTLDNRLHTNYAALKWALTCLVLASMKSEDSNCIENIMQNFQEALSAALSAQCELLDQIEQSKPKGNIAYLLYEAYSEGMFRMAKKLEKLDVRDGIIWEDDFCLRKVPLLNYIRKQPGYHDYTINKITRELQDIGALITNESDTCQVHLAKDAPRVYRMIVKVLKENAKKY